MLHNIILYWFRTQASKAAKDVLAPVFRKEQIQDILKIYWKRYLALKLEVPPMTTIGSSLMVHLSAMSAAFYQELTASGKDEQTATQLFYDIGWKVYQKMGKFCWWLAGWNNRRVYDRLLKATQLFRMFPFNAPSYRWKEVKTDDNNVVRFDCLKCPVAEYFKVKGLSKFCAATWCALDYPLAKVWGARLERSGSIAGGAKVCDFKWKVDAKPLLK